MVFDVFVYVFARSERVDLEFVQGMERDLNNSLKHIQKIG